MTETNLFAHMDTAMYAIACVGIIAAVLLLLIDKLPRQPHKTLRSRRR